MGGITRKPAAQSDSSRIAQFELPLPRKPQRQLIVDPDTIRRQRDFHAAILLCIAASGLADKELYGPLEIDAATWSRIRSGDANFPENKLNALCDLCGNDIPLQWWAYSRGKELKPLLSTLEQELEAERARRIEVELENDIMRRLWKETR